MTPTTAKSIVNEKTIDFCNSLTGEKSEVKKDKIEFTIAAINKLRKNIIEAIENKQNNLL